MVPVQYEAGNGRDKEGIGSSFLKPKKKPKRKNSSPKTPQGNPDKSHVKIFKKATGLHIKI